MSLIDCNFSSIRFNLHTVDIGIKTHTHTHTHKQTSQEAHLQPFVKKPLIVSIAMDQML